MEYVGRRPAPPLDGYVERTWHCTGALDITRARRLPGGGALDLLIDLTGDGVPVLDAAGTATASADGAILLGPSTRGVAVAPPTHVTMVGVHFRPGGAHPFLGASPKEFLDSHVRLDDLWGGGAVELRERLAEAPTALARLDLLEAALRHRLRDARPGHPAVPLALRLLRTEPHTPRIADIAEEVGLSQRRFIEVVEREVGLTPKRFARLRRFHRAKSRLAGQQAAPEWAMFALDQGYFDQSHLIRDFGEFSGLSPAGYVRSREDETAFDHFVHAYGRR